MKRARIVLAAILLVALGLGLGLLIRLNPDMGTTPDSAARRAAESLESGAVGSGPWTDPGAADAGAKRALAPLGALGVAHPAVVDVGEVTRTDDAHATARVRIGWITDPGSATQVPDWTYDSALTVRKERLSWRAVWDPAIIHPRLSQRRGFAVETTGAERGPVTAADGTAIASTQDIVAVGIERARAKDPAAVARRTAAITGVDGEALTARVARAKPHAFVEAITLRRSEYRRLAGRLRPLAGTVFHAQRRPIALRTGFAASALGRVGPATAEQIRAGGPAVRAGQLVGQSGIQRAFDSALRGRPGFAVRIVGPADVERASRTVADGDAEGAAAADADLPEPERTGSAQRGAPVATSLDIPAQESLDTALAQHPAVHAALVRPDGTVAALGDGRAADGRAADGGAADGRSTGGSGGDPTGSRTGLYPGGPVAVAAAAGASPQGLGTDTGALGLAAAAPEGRGAQVRSSPLAAAGALASARAGRSVVLRMAAEGTGPVTEPADAHAPGRAAAAGERDESLTAHVAAMRAALRAGQQRTAGAAWSWGSEPRGSWAVVADDGDAAAARAVAQVLSRARP